MSPTVHRKNSTGFILLHQPALLLPQISYFLKFTAFLGVCKHSNLEWEAMLKKSEKTGRRTYIVFPMLVVVVA